MKGAAGGGERRTVEATVIEILPQLSWRVTVENQAEIVVHAAPESARNFVRIRPGDRVAVELSPHDPGRGRIVRLLKG